MINLQANIASENVFDGNLKEIVILILFIFLFEKDLVIRFAALLLHGKPLLYELNLMLAWLWVKLYEFAPFVIVLEWSLGFFEVDCSIRAKAFFKEDITVDSVVGLNKARIIFIHVLLAWNEGQFGYFHISLVARRSMLVSLRLFSLLLCLFAYLPIIDWLCLCLIADLS